MTTPSSDYHVDPGSLDWILGRRTRPTRTFDGPQEGVVSRVKTDPVTHEVLEVWVVVPGFHPHQEFGPCRYPVFGDVGAPGVGAIALIHFVGTGIDTVWISSWYVPPS